MTSVLDGLEIIVGRLSGSRLVEDYYAGAPQLSSFYGGYPWSIDAFSRRAAQVKRGATAEREKLMHAAVQATSQAAADRLKKIAKGDGFVVTTGQQTGLFGGPLYTAYKILTAVRLARTLEQALGVPVAPLFWIPADDHDWDEVNHVSVIDAQNQLQHITLESSAESASSMALRTIGPGSEAALEQLAGAIPANDFSREQLDILRKAYDPRATMAQSYRELIAHTFAPYDLLITAASEPALKRFSVPLIVRELEHTVEHGALLRSQTDRLVAAGYHEQVAIATDAANVMYEDENGRERLMREGDGWILRRTKRSFTHAELIEVARREPERFSANVLLRPVVESYAFPTLAYVGGPAELSYFAQTGCLFAAHDVAMPLVFPRASIDLVEAKIRKVLDKFTLQPADLRRPFHELASQIARDDLPESVRTGLQALRADLTQDYGHLASAVTSIDPTLKGPLESARNAGLKQVDDMERKILGHLKKQNEIGLEQLRKASTNLFPNGERQERGIGTINYLGRYGPSLLNGILDAVDIQINAAVEGWDGVRCA
jgi:bacillithiol synthase